MSELALEKESANYRQAPVLNAEMTWLNPDKRGLGYRTQEVTWTNTTGETVELDDDTHNVWLMDEHGYAVLRTYVRLDEELNIDDTELQPDDYVVVNSGDLKDRHSSKKSLKCVGHSGDLKDRHSSKNDLKDRHSSKGDLKDRHSSKKSLKCVGHSDLF